MAITGRAEEVLLDLRSQQRHAKVLLLDLIRDQLHALYPDVISRVPQCRLRDQLRACAPAWSA
jgi:hypothetical protein